MGEGMKPKTAGAPAQKRKHPITLMLPCHQAVGKFGEQPKIGTSSHRQREKAPETNEEKEQRGVVTGTYCSTKDKYLHLVVEKWENGKSVTKEWIPLAEKSARGNLRAVFPPSPPCPYTLVPSFSDLTKQAEPKGINEGRVTGAIT